LSYRRGEATRRSGAPCPRLGALRGTFQVVSPGTDETGSTSGCAYCAMIRVSAPGLTRSIAKLVSSHRQYNNEERGTFVSPFGFRSTKYGNRCLAPLKRFAKVVGPGTFTFTYLYRWASPGAHLTPMWTSQDRKNQTRILARDEPL
jgi:hypothetical protein